VQVDLAPGPVFGGHRHRRPVAGIEVSLGPVLEAPGRKQGVEKALAAAVGKRHLVNEMEPEHPAHAARLVKSQRVKLHKLHVLKG